MHGDLRGNVLFADPLAPAIIDFSPYRRPPGWASAVVAVDAVTTCDAALALLAAVASPPAAVHALLFRHVSESEPTTCVVQYRPAIEYVIALSDTAAAGRGKRQPGPMPRWWAVMTGRQRLPGTQKRQRDRSRRRRAAAGRHACP